MNCIFRQFVAFLVEVLFAASSATYQSWVRAAAGCDVTAQTAITGLLQRPEVEFYDVLIDPEEMSNLATDPGLARERARHREQLDGWMLAQRDRGQATEMEALLQMKRYVEEPSKGAAEGKKEGRKVITGPFH